MQSTYSRCKSVTSVCTQLKKAVKSRDVAAIIHLLNCNVRFNITKSLYGETLLHEVFKDTYGNLELQSAIIKVLEVLLDSGINVNIKDNAEQTVLHLAIKDRMTEVVDFLISRGADLSVCDRFGNSILHFSIQREFSKFMEYCSAFNPRGGPQPLEKQGIDFIGWMLSKGLDVDCVDENGDTALHLAAKYNLLHALPALLDYTTDVSIVNDRNMTAFQIFVESIQKFVGKFRMTQHPYAKNYGIPTNNYEAEYVDDVFKKFLDKGFSVDVVDFNGRTPVHHTLKQDRWHHVKMMLRRLTNVNVCDIDGNTVLHIVMDCYKRAWGQIRTKYEGMVRILVSKGADIHKANRNGYSPLVIAVMYNELTVLEIFQESGLEFGHHYKSGHLLHFFCKSKTDNTNRQACETIFDMLVDQGCDVDARDIEGMTSLHYAAQRLKTEVAERLIEYGANVHSRELSFHRYTPLHEAIENNHLKLLETLMENGADINARTSFGRTVLHLVRYCSEEKNAIKRLVEYGAQVDVVDDSGFLPLQTAILRRDIPVIKELLKFGADINDNTDILDVNNYDQISKFISQHLVKLKIAELPIAEELMYFLAVSDEMPEYRRQCVKELESFKIYEISHRISLYNLLHMNRNDVCSHVKNKYFKRFVCTPRFERLFPKYHMLISATYYMAIARQKMLKPARRAWVLLTDIRLPDLCVNEILGHLSNVSLRVMIEGVRDRSFRKSM